MKEHGTPRERCWARPRARTEARLGIVKVLPPAAAQFSCCFVRFNNPSLNPSSQRLSPPRPQTLCLGVCSSVITHPTITPTLKEIQRRSPFRDRYIQSHHVSRRVPSPHGIRLSSRRHRLLWRLCSPRLCRRGRWHDVLYLWRLFCAGSAREGCGNSLPKVWRPCAVQGEDKEVQLFAKS